jgi:isoleucyl-tRNA synthetase
VHLSLFPKPEEIFSENPASVLNEWRELFEIRDHALRQLERSRNEKLIGKALEADLKIYANGNQLALLQRHSSDLKEFINVSSVAVIDAATPGVLDDFPLPEVMGPKGTSLSSLIIAVFPASGHKCARCWNFMPEVSAYGIWQNVCTRCQSALKEMGIAPPEAAVE